MFGNTYYILFITIIIKSTRERVPLKILKQKQLGRIATLSLVSIFILRLNNHILDNKHIVFTMPSFGND